MRIALCGPMYSGKSTFAKQLEAEQGFYLADFTTLLKRRAAMALSASTGTPVDVRHIEVNKSYYRSFLQELGKVIHFNTDKAYVDEALLPWLKALAISPRQANNVVFDNVRTIEQWNRLQHYDFTLVRILVSEEDLRTRAVLSGSSVDEMYLQLGKDIESFYASTTVKPVCIQSNKDMRAMLYELREKLEAIGAHA